MSKNDQGKFAYSGLERVLHEKARLSIMTSLFTNKNGCSFNDLKELCSLTDGNLSRHIQILKKSDFINVLKGYHDNKPITICKITELGKEKYLVYVNELEKVIRDAKKISGHEKDIKSIDLSHA